MKVTTARMEIKLEYVTRFAELAVELVKTTNQEAGCEVYKLYQEVGQPASFIFYEEYKDQAALDFHFASVYLKEFLEKTKEMLASEVILKVY